MGIWQTHASHEFLSYSVSRLLTPHFASASLESVQKKVGRPTGRPKTETHEASAQAPDLLYAILVHFVNHYLQSMDMLETRHDPRPFNSVIEHISRSFLLEQFLSLIHI